MSDRFNLSRWAIQNSALTRYLMIALVLLGIGSYFQLGQDEDPPFAFRAMVIRTMWPGATAIQVSDQVTNKIERTLQEVPSIDKIRSFSHPGESMVIFFAKDSTPAKEIPNLFYTVRKKVSDSKSYLPMGVQGPYFDFRACADQYPNKDEDASKDLYKIDSFPNEMRENQAKSRHQVKIHP